MGEILQGPVFRWWSSSWDGISIWVMCLMIHYSRTEMFPAMMKYGTCSSSTMSQTRWARLAQGTIGEWRIQYRGSSLSPSLGAHIDGYSIKHSRPRHRGNTTPDKSTPPTSFCKTSRAIQMTSWSIYASAHSTDAERTDTNCNLQVGEQAHPINSLWH
jgi:hypothetical protein